MFIKQKSIQWTFPFKDTSVSKKASLIIRGVLSLYFDKMVHERMALKMSCPLTGDVIKSRDNVIHSMYNKYIITSWSSEVTHKKYSALGDGYVLVKLRHHVLFSTSTLVTMETVEVSLLSFHELILVSQELAVVTFHVDTSSVVMVLLSVHTT